MTAYSFGNRWVGIIALREPPSAVPEPLHRMAARLAGVNRTRPLSLGYGVTTSAGDASRQIRKVGQRLSFNGHWERSDACASLATALEIGRDVSLPEWLRNELLADRKQAGRHRRRGGDRQPQQVRRARVEQPARRISVEPALPPQLPDYVQLPPLPTRMAQDLARFGVDKISEPTVSRWVSLATLHRSALYESAELSDAITPGLLDLLNVLGQVWLNVIVMEHAESQTDFNEARAVADAVAVQGAHARGLVARWVATTGNVTLGRGEAAQLADGRSGRAVFDSVALQVLGALALTAGSPAAIAAVVKHLWSPPPAEAGRDWRTELQRHLGYSPEATTESTGPDHAREFTVTIRDRRGAAADGKGSSLKVAHREAARAYLVAHAPAVAAGAQRRVSPAVPRPYAKAAAVHQQAVKRMLAEFSLPIEAAPWLTQALTHASWTHENRQVVARHSQRSNGALAAQGSHVLNALAAHRNVLSTVRRTLRPTADEARIQSVPNEFAANLFDTLRVGSGVLRGRGQPSVPPKARLDVVQAITTVAWRFRRTDLLHEPPAVLQQGLDDLTFEHDASTQLQILCSSIDVSLEVDYEQSGATHDRENSALLTFRDGTGSIDTWGPWVRGSKTAAKKAAAAEVIELVVAHAGGDLDSLEEPDHDLLAFLIAAELGAASRLRSETSAFSRRRLGLDLLAGGDLAGFIQWARRTEELIGVDTAHHFGSGPRMFYTDQLQARRWVRDGTIGESGRAVCRWVRALADAGDVPMSGAEWSRLNGLGAALAAMTDEPATAGDVPAHIRDLLRDESARVDDRLGEARTRALRPGVAGLAQEVVAQCLAIGERRSKTPEISFATTDEGATVAIRIPGVDLGATLSVLVEIMPSLVPGFRSSADGEDVMMTLPWEVEPDSVLARTGLDAITESLSDSRLDDLRTATLELVDVVAAWATEDAVGEASDVALRAVGWVDRLESTLRSKAVRMAAE